MKKLTSYCLSFVDYYSNMLFSAEKRQRQDAEYFRNDSGVVLLLPVGKALERYAMK